MDSFSHTTVASGLLDYLEQAEGVTFDRKAFYFGNLKPDLKGEYLTKPHFPSLMFEGDSQLEREWREGKFQLLSPPQVAQETLLLLENIDSEGSVFRSNHASNYLSLRGTLNQDREAMCNVLRKALDGQMRYKNEMFRAL